MAFDIYLSPPHMSGNEMAMLTEAFNSNWIAPLGPQVDAFEREIAAYLGTGIGALSLSSGTAALHLALKLAEIGPGDVVLCSSLTFIASANPIVYCGGRPVFVDSTPEGWNMSAHALKKAIAALRREGVAPKAAVVANLYGESADYDEILPILRENKIVVIEDAAESFGASYGGRKSGTFGEYAILSFNGNKIITTSGGGALLSHQPEALAKARFWATQARDLSPHYQHSEIGYNYRLSNLLAGIGRAQLAVLDQRVAARRAIFVRYVKELESIPAVSLPRPKNSANESTHWLSVMLIDPARSSVRPMEIIEKLASHGIESRPVWKPLHLQPVFAGEAFYSHLESGSDSERKFHTGVCLPSGSSLTPEQQDQVIDLVRQFFV